MTKKLILIGLIIVAVMGGILAINSSNKKDDMSSMSMSASSHSDDDGHSHSHMATETSTVSIKDFAFSPSSINIKVGTTVTWTNNDSARHTVTADNGSNGPKSSELAQGQEYSYTFKTAGMFDYHCEIHPSMRGMVMVSN